MGTNKGEGGNVGLSEGGTYRGGVCPPERDHGHPGVYGMWTPTRQCALEPAGG